MSQDTKLALIEASPFLTGLANRFPELLDKSPDTAIKEICNNLQTSVFECSDDAAIKVLVRNARSQAALTIALADIEGVWGLEQVTHALTQVADACLNATINWLFLDAHRQGKLQLNDEKNPSNQCGYVALAMGKHGGHELNFSSDIDLIILFDAERAPLCEGVEPNQFFVRMTKQLSSILQQMTAQGYAYRVDLRLRPDPRATQIAISFDAALIYYESVGQNWERAAMIKARPAAGDIELGNEFLSELLPFIWRKYLDFATIAEVHSLKKQINAVKGHAKVAVLGHNVKLGRGGIREIEFFVQTQQLIAGGRNKALRGKSTLLMLDELVKARWVEAQTAVQLQDAYRFLRQIEHRIQMIDDQQTHTLTTDPERFAVFAKFAGFDSAQSLETKLRETFELVQGHYDHLFEDDENPQDERVWVFDGEDDDESTLENLANLGFGQPMMVSSTIRGWYIGRYGAMRSNVARERLTEILPALLKALSGAGDADGTFAAFDRFLSGLPTGIQLFSLLKAHPQYLELIANILGSAPRLAQEMSRHPKMLDAVLEPSFFEDLTTKQQLDEVIASQVPDDLPFDLVLDQTRVVAREQMFRIGVRSLSDTLNARDAGQAYSDLAQSLIERLLKSVQLELQQRYGIVETGRICVVAMGKLGGYEMSSTSDLDLIVIYDHQSEHQYSTGPKQISTNQYYARVTQRLITSLSAPTSEGVLYEVDMRLRPSGNKGPIATHIDAFIDYQNNSAWTWEKLALTRARVIAGDDGFKSVVEAAITDCLCAKRDTSQVFKDAISMRKTMLEAKQPKSVWDIKSHRGGVVDLEFIVQSLQISHAHQNKKILSTNILAAIRKLSAANILKPEVANQLDFICRLYQQLSQILTLGVSGVFDPKIAPVGLKKLISTTMSAPDIAHAQAILTDTQVQLKEIFDREIGRLDYESMT